jgi:hypothetical protein
MAASRIRWYLSEVPVPTLAAVSGGRFTWKYLNLLGFGDEYNPDFQAPSRYHSRNFRKACPRWLYLAFSSAEISAKVLPNSGK